MREFTGLADSSFSTFTRYRLTGYEPHIARTGDVSLRATAGGMTPCRIRLKKFRPAGIQVRQGRKPQLPCPQTQKRPLRITSDACVFLSFLLRELKPPDLTPVRAAAVSLLPEEKASVTGEKQPHWKYG